MMFFGKRQDKTRQEKRREGKGREDNTVFLLCPRQATKASHEDKTRFSLQDKPQKQDTKIRQDFLSNKNKTRRQGKTRK
jgi:hypothetical protein